MFKPGDPDLDDHDFPCCVEPVGGYFCTLPEGHGGPQHVASGSSYVIATLDIETGETAVK